MFHLILYLVGGARDQEYADCISSKSVSSPPSKKTSVLSITLNCI